MKVAIIGYGHIGEGIARVLDDADDLQLDIWDIDRTKVPRRRELSSVMADADIVFLCVPTVALLEVLRMVRPFLHRRTVLVSISKGLDDKGRTTADIMEDAIPDQPYALLLGPMLADELKKGAGGSAVIAAKSRSVFTRMRRLFEGAKLNVEVWNDPRSAAYAAVLKNVYTLAIGMAVGLGWGRNRLGRLSAACLEEMPAVLRALKADSRVCWTSAGYADFLATSSSPSSVNRRAGEEIVREGKTLLRSEGLQSLRPLKKKLSKSLRTFPILQRVMTTVHGASADQVWV